MAASVTGAILNVVLNYIFIGKYGITIRFLVFSACVFRSESMRMLMFVVEPAIQSSPFLPVVIVYAVCTKNAIFCTNN